MTPDVLRSRDETYNVLGRFLPRYKEARKWNKAFPKYSLSWLKGVEQMQVGFVVESLLMFLFMPLFWIGMALLSFMRSWRQRNCVLYLWCLRRHAAAAWDHFQQYVEWYSTPISAAQGLEWYSSDVCRRFREIPDIIPRMRGNKRDVMSHASAVGQAVTEKRGAEPGATIFSEESNDEGLSTINGIMLFEPGRKHIIFWVDFLRHTQNSEENDETSWFATVPSVISIERRITMNIFYMLLMIITFPVMYPISVFTLGFEESFRNLLRVLGLHL